MFNRHKDMIYIAVKHTFLRSSENMTESHSYTLSYRPTYKMCNKFCLKFMCDHRSDKVTKN